MCGICGILYFESDKAIPKHKLELMVSTLHHRGPDDKGIFISDQVGLGMSRLSIVDLNFGHQPIFNEVGDVVLVFNGEIYNYESLRKLLISSGHTLKTRSDTEVIVHLYEDYGFKCLDYMDGMFAFAIWDNRNKKLFLARDRLGEKPLFYAIWPGGLVFGSELKAILAADLPISHEVDLHALSHYFSFMTVPTPLSILKSVKKLPPGCYLTCDSDGNIQVQQYWDITEWGSDSFRSDNSYLDELDALLNQSVQKRLIGDVPIGAFLSGGVDSSIVVAHMSQISNKPVQTFSVTFDGPSDYNEGSYARAVAQRFGTDHHELVVRPNILNDIEKLVWHWDEPFAVSSAVPLYYMSQAAREYVKVVLTGDGADEVFAGYSRYYLDKWICRTSRLPIGLFLTPARPEHRNMPNWLRRMAKFLSAAELGPDIGYVYLLSQFSQPEKQMVFSKDLLVQLKDEEGPMGIFQRHYNIFKGNSSLNRRIYADLKVSLVDEMLTKVDRMTMAVGLEARPPLLDYKLVEFAARLPSRLKVRGRTSKYLLKRHAEKILPSRLVYRKKHGFNVPLDEWIRGELREFAWDTLCSSSSCSSEYLDRGNVVKILNWHIKGKGNWGHHIWIMLILELWLQMMKNMKNSR